MVELYLVCVLVVFVGFVVVVVLGCIYVGVDFGGGWFGGFFVCYCDVVVVVGGWVV